MQNNLQHSGVEGEAIARTYLESGGYRILEANWRFRRLEVDLIAEKDGIMVFVEVKTRKSNAFGEPETFVTKKKQSFLISAAHQYLNINNIRLESRFDIISVIVTGDTHSVQHLVGAFYPRVK